MPPKPMVVILTPRKRGKDLQLRGSRSFAVSAAQDDDISSMSLRAASSVRSGLGALFGFACCGVFFDFGLCLFAGLLYRSFDLLGGFLRSFFYFFAEDFRLLLCLFGCGLGFRRRRYDLVRILPGLLNFARQRENCQDCNRDAFHASSSGFECSKG